MPYHFVQVDVFTRKPLYGNPAAVFFDADGLDTQTMQKIAQEMNLSETVFLCKPTTPEKADYHARIFTPKSELPFAGHPTIASAHSFVDQYPETASATLLRQECGIGIVPIEVMRTSTIPFLRMTQGTPYFEETKLSRTVAAEMLGCSESDLADSPIEIVSTGVRWLIIELSSLKAITELTPNQSLITEECRAIKATGITVFAERGDSGPVRVRLRTFAPGEGVNEDPVCGSGNGSVAAFIAKHKHAAESRGSYVSEQGIEIGRDGEIHAYWERVRDGVLQVKIGGEAVIVARGQLLL
jgi:PhzF family phenazine biosynthesis protein